MEKPLWLFPAPAPLAPASSRRPKVPGDEAVERAFPDVTKRQWGEGDVRQSLQNRLGGSRRAQKLHYEGAAPPEVLSGAWVPEMRDVLCAG